MLTLPGARGARQPVPTTASRLACGLFMSMWLRSGSSAGAFAALLAGATGCAIAAAQVEEWADEESGCAPPSDVLITALMLGAPDKLRGLAT